MSKRKGQGGSSMAKPDASQAALLTDLRQLIEQAKQAAAAAAVNAGRTMMYLHIGKRIRQEILGHARAEDGKEILPTLSAELLQLNGRGFSARSLWRMVQFAETFPDEQIVASLWRQLLRSQRV